MSTAELKSTLHRYIVETDDLNMLQQIKSFVQELKNTSTKGNNSEMPEEKAQLVSEIKEAIEELKLIKAGKLEGIPAEKLFDEL